jgi:N-acetylglutamate synthase-like GNAT family acetyltransferase
MSLQCRKSTGLDILLVDDLLEDCFGEMRKYDALNNLEGRYMLIFDEDMLIGMTGLIQNSDNYFGAEIDNTCLLPRYRGRGIITNTLKKLIENCDTDIYCSCPKLPNKEKSVLHFAMEQLKFTPILEAQRKYNSDFNVSCDFCFNRIENKCECQEDLYVRYANKK